jgi:hypothetical protein
MLGLSVGFGSSRMSFDSRAYRILIASPSDVDDERDIAVRVIQEWNDLHSYNRKVVLLPLRWETHTAPEYGTRPQEVINRAIVDQCDLLIGVFWTRVGSPTGISDSGTLEEIDRVAKAGKPVMLYFSKIGVDPGTLDLEQVKKLKQFKERIYPQALTESYRSIIEFRDKFAKQLELKVRDLQRAETTGPPAIHLSFLSPETGELLGSTLTVKARLPIVRDSDEFMKSADKEKRTLIAQIISERIAETVAVPTVLAVQNATSSGVRDLYAEIAIGAESKRVQIARSLSRSKYSTWTISSSIYSTVFDLAEPSPVEAAISEKISHLEQEGFSKEGDGWKLSFEWGALQPQRMRLVKPVMFVMASESTALKFSARFFADGFAQPLDVAARLEIVVDPIDVTVDELLPDIRARLAEKPAVSVATGKVLHSS